MGSKLATMEPDDLDLMEEGNASTQVADWVIRLDLSHEAFLLYLRMCAIAKDQDVIRAVTFTQRLEDLDGLAKGDGRAALEELLEVRALKTKVKHRNGSCTFEIQIYSPQVRALLFSSDRTNDAPVASHK